MRWLRETADRATPMWLRYLTVALVVVAFIVVRSVAELPLLQTVIVGAIVGGSLATAAKLIWAALNPLPRPGTDPIFSRTNSTRVSGSMSVAQLRIFM